VVGEHFATHINPSDALLQFLAFDIRHNVSEAVA
jgi:hypothetical protein